MSKFIPNAFQTPNAYVDEYLWLLSPEEWVVITYAARRIFGFNKDSDRIGMAQFRDGIKTLDGRYLDHGTGLPEGSIRKAIRALIDYRLLIVINKATATEATEYSLQLNSDNVDRAGLIARFEAKKASDAKRSQNAQAVVEGGSGSEPGSYSEGGGGSGSEPGVVPVRNPQYTGDNQGYTDTSSVALAPSELNADGLQPLQQTLGFVIAEPVKSVPEPKQKEPRETRKKARPGFEDAKRAIFETLPIKYSHGEMGKAANFVLDQAQQNGWDVDTVYDDIVALYKNLMAKEFWQTTELHPMALAKQYRFWRANHKEKPIAEATTPAIPFKAQPLIIKERQDEPERRW